MAALNNESLMDGNGGIKEGSLKSILTNTIDTIENSKSQIFEIYETARTEVENSKKQLQGLKEQAR